jgi:hypothetical protein
MNSIQYYKLCPQVVKIVAKPYDSCVYVYVLVMSVCVNVIGKKEKKY